MIISDYRMIRTLGHDHWMIRTLGHDQWIIRTLDHDHWMIRGVVALGLLSRYHRYLDTPYVISQKCSQGDNP